MLPAIVTISCLLILGTVMIATYLESRARFERILLAWCGVILIAGVMILALWVA